MQVENESGVKCSIVCRHRRVSRGVCILDSAKVIVLQEDGQSRARFASRALIDLNFAQYFRL